MLCCNSCNTTIYLIIVLSLTWYKAQNILHNVFTTLQSLSVVVCKNKETFAIKHSSRVSNCSPVLSLLVPSTLRPFNRHYHYYNNNYQDLNHHWICCQHQTQCGQQFLFFNEMSPLLLAGIANTFLVDAPHHMSWCWSCPLWLKPWQPASVMITLN